MGSSLSVLPEQTELPLYAVNGVCPDWFKWEGIPEYVFSLLQHVQEEERHCNKTTSCEHVYHIFTMLCEVIRAYHTPEKKGL